MLRALASSLLLACLLGCDAPASQGYAEAVTAGRSEKDHQFVVDPDSPIPAGLRNAFHGLQYWPVDPRYRLTVPLQEFETKQRFTIVTTMGEARPCERFGKLTFALDGADQELTVYRFLDGPRTGTAADKKRAIQLPKHCTCMSTSPAWIASPLWIS